MEKPENPQHDPELTPDKEANEGGNSPQPNASDAIREGEPPAVPQADDAVDAVEQEPSITQSLTKNGWIVVLLLAVIVFIYTRVGAAGMLSVAKVAIGLGIVIFIHELGHFLVAKWCGVQVDVFSIGFGPAIPGCRFKWGETTYLLAVFPFGGYVQMLGQVDLEETDDGTEENPRSYKNKAVWQRMAIISAGVVMNAFLAAACFAVVFLIPGKNRISAVVAAVDSRSPSFENGIPFGATIDQIGGLEKPYFEDIMLEVLSHHVFGSELKVAYTPDGGVTKTVSMMPRKKAGDSRPMIGISFSKRLQLFDKRGASGFKTPAKPNSAATKAKPPLAFGDKIVGIADADSPDPGRAILPIDKRVPAKDPNRGQKDFIAFAKRMQRLAGKDVVLLVERDGKEIKVRVPPAYHRSLGAVMGMGEITAIRNGSPADTAGVQMRDGNKSGDVIEAVEFSEPGGSKTSTFAVDPKKKNEKQLDPVRLPDQLRSWAKRLRAANASKELWRVTLFVKRQNPPKKDTREFTRKKLVLQWDDDWRFDRIRPISPGAPQPIPELGLGYLVTTTVIAPELADDDKLKKNDVIEQVKIHQQMNQKEASEENTDVGSWYDLRGDKKQQQWANMAYRLDSPVIIEIELQVRRYNTKTNKTETKTIKLVPAIDDTWPRANRGLLLAPDMRLEKATGLFEGVALGMRDTYNKVREVFLVIVGMATGSLSTDNVGGPLRILSIGFQFAEFDFWEFVFFIGMISINIAVINFLPIPILDGGHMVFLTYELVRGKPASERVRIGAMYGGLAIIAMLFLLIMYLDISHLFF